MQRDPSSSEPRATKPKRTGAADPHAIRARGREQELLASIVGRYQVHGYNEPAAHGERRVTVTGSQEYRWVPGEFFVRGHWDHRFGERVHQGVSLLGFEPEHGVHFAHHYDNLGYARTYTVTIAGYVWTFHGQFERACLEFSPDGSRYHESWQLKKDGQSFWPLCELEVTRQTP